ncbi:MAG TPA: hypothetical protein DCZ95_05190 [Verrucomicrobia bacterium]|nr:hypothetical protein [Verrucomicrobiota bacterium]
MIFSNKTITDIAECLARIDHSIAADSSNDSDLTIGHLESAGKQSEAKARRELEANPEAWSAAGKEHHAELMRAYRAHLLQFQRELESVRDRLQDLLE